MEELGEVQVCRLCANFFVTGMEFVSLLEPVEEFRSAITFVNKVLLAWNIKISSKDGLPCIICANCYATFNAIHMFYRECQDAQQKLNKLLIESNSNEQPTQVQITVPIENYNSMKDTVQISESNTLYSSFEQHILQSCVSSAGKSEPVTGDPIEQSSSLSDEHVKNIEIKADLSVEEFAEDKNIVDDQNKILEANASKETLENTVKTAVFHTEFTRGDFTESGNKVEKKYKEDVDHCKTSNFNDPIICQYCYYNINKAKDALTFQDSDRLSQHIFDAHDPNCPYSCCFCPEIFKTAAKRDQHVRLLHSTCMEQEQCKFCKKVVRSSLESHELSCTFVGSWECAACGEKFQNTTRHRFLAHERHHDMSKQLQCNLCTRVFIRRSNLEAHERQHIQEAHTLIFCTDCKGAFCGEYELKRHQYQAHNGELPVTCNYCLKGFISTAFLNRHVLHFHPEKLSDSNLTSVTCGNCNVVFPSVHKLRYHTQRPRDENGNCIDESVMHKKRKRMKFSLKLQHNEHWEQCDHCKVRCHSALEMKQHISREHSHIKSFNCKICRKGFKFKKDLRDHVLFHAGFHISCTEKGCEYVCKSENALSIHIREKHRAVRCKYCLKIFPEKRLEEHVCDVQIQDKES